MKPGNKRCGAQNPGNRQPVRDDFQVMGSATSRFLWSLKFLSSRAFAVLVVRARTTWVRHYPGSGLARMLPWVLNV